MASNERVEIAITEAGTKVYNFKDWTLRNVENGDKIGAGLQWWDNLFTSIEERHGGGEYSAPENENPNNDSCNVTCVTHYLGNQNRVIKFPFGVLKGGKNKRASLCSNRN